MTSGLFQPEAATTKSFSLRLEVAGRKEPTPLVIPVLLQNMSMGVVTLALTNPWGIADWDRYRGENCILWMDDPGGLESVAINGTISWTRVGVPGQQPTSLGVQLVKAPEEVLSRLNGLLTHTPEDIKGLWDRYDQIQKIPGPSSLIHHCYIAGLVLLVGGLVLQFTGSNVYKFCGWVLWLLGSLGIAGKIIRPLWQKRFSGDQIGKTL